MEWQIAGGDFGCAGYKKLRRVPNDMLFAELNALLSSILDKAGEDYDIARFQSS
jgi:hypothetical protein